MKLPRGFLSTAKTISKHFTSGYTYTNTRVKAMKGKLLKRDEFEKFVKMSIPEITRYLQETEYNKEITELAPKFSGINLVEYSLNKNLENMFSKTLNFAIQQAKKEIRIYLRKYDIANIKTILRGKFSKVSNEKVVNELIAGGDLSRNLLEHIIKDSSSLEQAVESFKDTEYYSILRKFSNDFNKLEDELDKFYYRMVLQQGGKELKEYIRMEISIKNALNRLRAKKANIKIELVEGEKGIAVPFQQDSVEARVFMKKLLINRAIRMVHEIKRNFRPVLGYFIAKENEIANIRILARGKHSHIDENLIKEQLVI